MTIPYSEDDESAVYRSPEWIQTLQQAYGFNPLFLFSANGKLVPVTSLMEVSSWLTGKRAVCLPFADILNPTPTDAFAFKEVFDFLKNYGKKVGWKWIEFKGGNDFLNKQPPFMEFYIHRLPLHSDTGKMFCGLKSTARRNIRKAQKSGIEVEFSYSEDALKEYFDLHALTKKRHGIPVQPSNFFQTLHKNIIANKKGNIVLARMKGKAVAGAVFFQGKKMVVFVYGASDMHYQQFRPNNLLMWEAFRFFGTRGFRQFSFGITDLHNQGLRQFKNTMAAEERLHRYYRYNLETGTFVNAKTAFTESRRKLFRKTPIFFLKASGALLYKHTG